MKTVSSHGCLVSGFVVLSWSKVPPFVEVLLENKKHAQNHSCIRKFSFIQKVRHLQNYTTKKAILSQTSRGKLFNFLVS